MDTIVTADRILSARDGSVAAVGEATSVLVRDSAIHTVGTDEQTRAAARPGARELAHPGCTILPGLINTHVHLCGDLSREPFATARHGTDDALSALMQANALAALRGGCTTVRDLGDARGLAFTLRTGPRRARSPARGSSPRAPR